ncbi:uncharacterized protein LOC126835795 [Adelges cooleyi]|uniref:uncharacterized protein LOC126835795 n=1 Tax=Adelges cooleyi TaxID=133065 RepID=UPI0021801993|nr:uncharacterized protein LOC126835795 [Adelges cooleyi]
MTQSVGLNGEQIDMLRPLFTKHTKGIEFISKNEIVNIGQRIGVDNFSDFDYDRDVTIARKLEDFLVFLANNDKITDTFTRNLSSFEVRLYVGMFREKDQRGDGLLTYTEVLEVIKPLHLDKWTNRICLVRSVNQCTIDGFKKDEKTNALEFLYRMWAIKPEGKGLDRSQVQEASDLQKHHKNIYHDQIVPEAITLFLKRASIVKEDYEGKLAFGSKRKSFLELQELLVVSAEHKNNTKIKPVYSTCSVRYVIWDFFQRDTDKDGTLNKDEVLRLVICYMDAWNKENRNIDTFMLAHDSNRDGHLDIAEFFKALFQENISLSKCEIK